MKPSMKPSVLVDTMIVIKMKELEERIAILEKMMESVVTGKDLIKIVDRVAATVAADSGSADRHDKIIKINEEEEE